MYLKKFFFGLSYPTWKNFSEQIFSNDFLSCFEWKYCAVSQNVIFMSFIYLHFFNCKFLTLWSIDWFRFQKPLEIGPFQYQDAKIFGTKVWGGSLDFNTSKNNKRRKEKNSLSMLITFKLGFALELFKELPRTHTQNY